MKTLIVAGAVALLTLAACGDDREDTYNEGGYYDSQPMDRQSEYREPSGGFDVGDALIGAAVMNMMTSGRDAPVSASGHEQPWRSGMGEHRQTREQAVASRRVREERVREKTRRNAPTIVERARSTSSTNREKARAITKRVSEKRRTAPPKRRAKSMTKRIQKKRR